MSKAGKVFAFMEPPLYQIYHVLHGQALTCLPSIISSRTLSIKPFKILSILSHFHNFAAASFWNVLSAPHTPMEVVGTQLSCSS